MKAITKIFMLAALVCNLNFVSARRYYVSQESGSDRNAGTLAEPLRRISKAASEALAGDTIIIRGGVYREWVSPAHSGINAHRRITYMAQAGEDVWIKGSERITSWQRLKRGVWQAEIPNEIFGDYNPFDINIFGDWLVSGSQLHLGEVYLNNRALAEVSHVENLKGNTLSWVADVCDDVTLITANFGDANPNKELCEINVRKSCFFPKSTGVNFITVKGIKISQAATPWAPPTAEQWGAIGPHWSKGWIIEDCEVSNSKCVGISLGKERASGENMWKLYSPRDGYTKFGFTREIESILAAEEYGWSKELVGSHLIQNNRIFDCGQAGIVGHMGCAFSTIRGNEIFNINSIKGLSGHEIAGIKLHAAIDVVLENNIIINSWRGMWLDWQVQGTQVVGNIFDKNQSEDLFIEVSHGPTLVYNNIMLSGTSLLVNAQGIAFFNNLYRGGVVVWTSNNRYTPYHHAHSTKVRGLFNNNGGDVRLYNNIFLGRNPKKVGVNGWGIYDRYPKYDPAMGTGLNSVDQYLDFLFPVWSSGSVYYGESCKPYKGEDNYTEFAASTPDVKLEKRDGKYYFIHNIDFKELQSAQTVGVNTAMLGETIISELIFDNPDGTDFILDKDILGRQRNVETPTAGPFEKAFDSLIWQPAIDLK